MKDVVIELQNVKKIYKMDGVETHALRGVDLKIKKQEFILMEWIFPLSKNPSLLDYGVEKLVLYFSSLTFIQH
jgi:hypothetical protein